MSDLMSGAPKVSIITATYNRSNIIGFTIESVRRSTVENWEMIVVGDACTDDTAEVVAAIGDPRVRFVNLPENIGDQSGPNSRGMELAKGKYLALLNHDDLWFPDHLATALAAFETTDADLIFTLTAGVPPGGRAGQLHGANHQGIYEPWMFVPASCWVMRRELAEQIGPWRRARECYQIPSQEWLHRAWRAGARMRLAPRLTVLALHSIYLPGAYARRLVEEHRNLYQRLLHEPDLREKELTAALLPLGDGALRPTVWAPFRQALRNVYRRLCLTCGVAPQSVTNFLKHRRKGGRVAELRAIRGLPESGSKTKD